jgi:NAD(P)H-hydrate epimerase
MLHLSVIVILDIGLLPEFLASPEADLELIDRSIIRSIYKPRNRFAHKGISHAMISQAVMEKLALQFWQKHVCEVVLGY